MKTGCLSALGIISLALLTCEPPNNQKFDPEPNVMAVMNVQDSFTSQLVIVDKTYDIADTVEEYGVSAAYVKLSGGTDTFMFVDSFYNPDSMRWIKQPGGRYWGWGKFSDTVLYHVEIRYPGGDTVTAESYMPSPIHLYSPADEETISVSQAIADSQLVVWNSCRNTALYVVQCVPDVDTSRYGEFPFFIFIPSLVGDTAYPFFTSRVTTPWITNQRYVMRVTAYGTDYASYVTFGLSRGRRNILNTSGDTCYGVFSGISIDSVRVYLVP